MNLLGQAISGKINLWAKGEGPLAISKKNYDLDDQGCENIVKQSCQRLSDIQKINRRFYQTNKRARDKIKNTDALSRWVDFKKGIETNLQDLGLNEFEIDQFIRNATSFWLNRRFRSKLLFLKLHYSRIINNKDDSYESKKINLDILFNEAERSHSRLNNFFHRRLKSQFGELIDDINELRIQVSINIIKNLITNTDQNVKAIFDNKELLFSAIKVLPPAIQSSWHIFYNGLRNPRDISPTVWEDALKDIYTYLQIKSCRFFSLVQFFVKQYLSHAICSTKHPAHPLLVRYTDIRHDDVLDLKPKITVQDIKKNKNAFEAISDSVFFSINALSNLPAILRTLDSSFHAANSTSDGVL